MAATPTSRCDRAPRRRYQPVFSSIAGAVLHAPRPILCLPLHRAVPFMTLKMLSMSLPPDLSRQNPLHNDIAAGAARSALPEAALGVADLSLDDWGEDGAEGR